MFQAAVKDRIRTDRVGVLLSGGLDSAAVATTARALSRRPGEKLDLRAYTIVYESLIPDRDGARARINAIDAHYGGLAAPAIFELDAKLE